MGLLAVTVNENTFDYDIHSLVKAFFPDAEVRVTHDEENVASTDELPDIRISIDDFNIIFLIESEPRNALKVSVEGITDRIVKKNLLKQLIYHGLSIYTGKKLPWGALTGIRPVKLAMGLLNDGATEDEAAEFIRDVYLVSEEKTALSIDIAKREKKLIEDIHTDGSGYSLYVGIPFCPTRCLYCSFTSYPADRFRGKMEDYLNALFKEIDYVSFAFKDKKADSIYIGGGTPTALSPDGLKRLLYKLSQSIDLGQLKELTVEAGRPDSITKEKLMVLKEFNVNRISINPQTMNQATLDRIGRKHTVDDIEKAFYLARELLFDNINADIIMGLPDEGIDEIRHTMSEIKKLSPDSLTVHSLAIKRAAALALWSRENGTGALENTGEMMKCAYDGAYELDMLPYYLYRQKNMAGNFENVGFAKKNKYGIYNVAIMEEVQDVVACGAGTVSKHVYEDGRIKRCDTVKDLELYIKNIDEMIERKRRLYSK